MTSLRDAAQAALEALEAMTKHFGFARLGSSSLADTMKRGDAHVAMNNLRAALAEPEPQEIADLRQACQEGWRYADELDQERKRLEEDLRAALAEPDIDPVDEYRKGFIDGQIDMRDRPAEPVQAPVLTVDALRVEFERRYRGKLPPPLQEPTVKESLQVPAEVAATLTTTDIAWLATCRLTKLWQELGQMRWAGADEGWDRAIEAVRSRLNDECQSVLDWKAKADQSQATAVQLLRKMQGVKDD